MESSEPEAVVAFDDPPEPIRCNVSNNEDRVRMKRTAPVTGIRRASPRADEETTS
jgi:hypothetical protein